MTENSRPQNKNFTIRVIKFLNFILHNVNTYDT